MGTNSGGYLQAPISNLKKSYDPRKQSWYKAGLKNSNSQILNNLKDDLTITSIIAIKDKNGKVIGVQGIDFSLDPIIKNNKKIETKNKGNIILVNNSGTIISNPIDPKSNLKNVKEAGIIDLEKFYNLKDGNFKLSYNGVKYFANLYTSNSSTFKFIALIPESEILLSSTNIVILLFGLSVLLTIILSPFIFKLLRPGISKYSFSNLLCIEHN